MARPTAACSPSKAKVPPLLPRRSCLARCGTTKLGTPGQGVPPHEPTPRSNLRRPMTAAPTLASTSRSRRTATSISPSVPFPAIHACRRSPPSPIGSASRTFGPAVNPVQGHRHVQHGAPGQPGRPVRPDRPDLPAAAPAARRAGLGAWPRGPSAVLSTVPMGGCRQHHPARPSTLGVVGGTRLPPTRAHAARLRPPG
jgi:hypothetical protein